MKTTGVIRRIDDLGRIVIPKEIRKNLRINNGDYLEISVDDEKIMLEKYSPMKSIGEVASRYCDSFYQILKHNIIVTDRDKILAITGSLKKKYIGREISDVIEIMIDRRDNFVENKKKNIYLTNEDEEYGYYAFSTIINNGDAIGSVIILSLDNPIMETEEKMASIMSKLLGGEFID